jgi:RNA polymerase sigma-70 factor (ECF subfamily)
MTPEHTHPSAEPAHPDADGQLVARIRAGESSLFELIMRRHNQRIYRVARAIVRDDSEAQDVMQEAYVRAFTHLEQFEGRSTFATWLTRIAAHEALARIRRARREVPVGAGDEQQETTAMTTRPPSSDPQRGVEEHELRALLERAIDELPDPFRAVFVLRAIEELSVAETAESLDIAEETVKTRFFRARGMLQRRLAGRFEELAPSAFSFHRARCDRVVFSVMRRVGLAHGRTIA